MNLVNKYKIMKKLLVIVVLGLFLIIPSKADDIQDFEIEGMSLGSSALTIFTKSYIDSKGKLGYPNKKFKLATLKSDKFEIYDDIQIHYLSNDSKYIIHSISANIDFPNNISDCLRQKKEINEEIESLFVNAKRDDWGKRVLKNVDPSLETYAYQNIYWLDGGNIIVSCRDYGQTLQNEGHVDYLAIMADSKFFVDWLNSEAFK